MQGLDVVWNTLLAPVTLAEKLTRTRALGAALVFFGTASTTAFAIKKEREYTLEYLENTLFRSATVVYMIVLLFFLGFNIMYLQRRYPRKHSIRGLSLGITGGMLAGNLFCMKGLIELLKF